MTKVKPHRTAVKLSFDCSLFTGDYRQEGDSGLYYLNTTSGILIKLCRRNDYTPLRPQHYFMLRSADGKFSFLTSLYSDPMQQIYTAEIQRQYFAVEFSADRSSMTIKRKSP
jgi:hypothetical protein